MASIFEAVAINQTLEYFHCYCFTNVFEILVEAKLQENYTLLKLAFTYERNPCHPVEYLDSLVQRNRFLKEKNRFKKIKPIYSF